MPYLIAVFLMSLVFQGVSSYWRPRCNPKYSIAWWSIAPYIYKKNGSITGPFPLIMERMIRDCCQSSVNLSYNLMLANKVEAVEQVVNGTADFVLPIIVKSGKKKFLSFPFISLVESPGIAYYSMAPLSAGETLLKIIIDASPILILMSLLVMIAGTIYWFLEQRHHAPILPGIFNGMWWAFVSMTTVGYGDISPKSKKAKAAAVLWILVGLVACSLFVAVVSSVLTMACLSQKQELRGNKIAVIEGSQEHSYAIRKSALPIGVTSIEGIAKSLEQGTSTGALLDSYVAGFHQKRFKKFRLNDLKEDYFSYGVVLMPSVMKYEQCFKDFVSSNHEFFTHVVSDNIIPLKTTTNVSTAEEMSMNIFQFESVPVYIPILIILLSTIVISFLCLLKESIRRRKLRSKKNTSDNNQLYSDEVCLYENHAREISDCLKKILQEATLLQRICNQAFIRAEKEANILGYESSMVFETRL